MDKKRERAFNIDLFGLGLGRHKFQFEFDSTIFDDQQDYIINEGSGKCFVELVKSETLINFTFQISGEVKLTCDRSMEKFMYPLELEEKLILKYGHEFDDSNDEVWIIPIGYQTLNVRRNILEFINVAIPMKRLHPKFGEDDAQGMELVYSSETKEDLAKEETTDPRWEALRNLKNSEN